MSPGPKRPTRGVVLAVAGSVLAFSLAYSSYRGLVRGRPLSGSELGWIYASATSFSLFFLERDFGSPYWVSFYGLDHPPLGRYILGAALFFGLSEEDFSVARRQKMSPEGVFDSSGKLRPERREARIVLLARGFVVIVGSLCAVLVFLVGHRVFGSLPGILASILYVYHPHLIERSVTAMMDTTLLFWTLLSCLLALVFFEALEDGRRWTQHLCSVSLAVSLAVAAGSKLLGGWVGVAFLVASFLYWRLRVVGDANRVGTTRLLLQANAVVLLGSVLLFTAMYPSLHFWSHGKTPADLIRFRADEVRLQQTRRPEVALDLRGKARFLANNCLTLSAVRSEISQHGVVVGYRFRYSSLVGGVLLLGVGVGYCVLAARRRQPDVKVLVLVTFALTVFVLNTAWVPNNWLRYSLPVLPWKALLMSAGVLASAKGAAALWRVVRRPT